MVLVLVLYLHSLNLSIQLLELPIVPHCQLLQSLLQGMDMLAEQFEPSALCHGHLINKFEAIVSARRSHFPKVCFARLDAIALPRYVSLDNCYPLDNDLAEAIVLAISIDPVITRSYYLSSLEPMLL